jgi:hypothetical protein
VAEKGSTIAPEEYIVWAEIETRHTAQRKVKQCGGIGAQND